MNLSVEVIDKQTGNVEALDLEKVQNLSNSVVKLNVGPAQIDSFSNVDGNLSILLTSGEEVVIPGFFLPTGDERNELVLEDADNVWWWGQYETPWDSFYFTEITPLAMVPPVAEDGVPWWLIAAGLLGAAALIGSGGGGGSDNDDDGDTTPPDAPTNLAINDEGTVVTGEGEPGTTATVYDPDNNVIGQGPVDEDGNFEVELTEPQIDSEELDVTLTDDAGNESEPGTVIAPDLTAPDAPTIDGAIDDQLPEIGELTSGSSTNDTTPTLTGTAEANSTVTIMLDGIVIGTTTAAADGKWSYTPTSELTEGDYTFTATATDAAGNTSVPSSGFELIIDTTGPNQNDGNNSIAFDDGGDELINAAEATAVTLSGVVEEGGELLGITITDGTTTLTVDAADISVAADGSVSVSAQDLSGLADGTLTVTMSVADAAGNVGEVTDTSVLDTIAPAAPVINPTDGTVVTGSAEPGSTVNLDVDGDGVADYTVPAASDGSWSVDVDPDLADGVEISATATDEAGNTGPEGTQIVDIYLNDNTPPDAPIIESAIDDVDPNQGALASGSSTNDTTPTLTGTAEASSTVTVMLDGAVIGTTTAAADGQWSFTPTTELAEGDYTFTATATDAAGNTSVPSSDFNLNVDTTGPNQNDGNNSIAFNDGGDELLSAAEATSVTLSGMVEEGGEVVGITITDGTTTLTVDAADISVAADGTVSVSGQDLSGLADGTLTVTMTVADAAGNQGDVTDTTVLDTAAPAAPVIESAIDDVDPDQGALASGSSTNDTTPTLTGTAEANSTVTIMQGGVEIGTATAAADGQWSFTPATELAEGDYTFTATATDAAGNTSVPSADFALTVDTTGPSQNDGKNSIAFDDGGDELLNAVEATNVTLSGVVEDGGEVVGISITDGTTIITVDPADISVAADGTLSVSGQDLSGLANGTLTVTMTVADAAGNQGDVTDTTELNLTAPIVPTINAAIDDVDPDQGSLASGSSTNDTTPTLVGTAEADSTVTIMQDGVEIGTTTAAADGQWSFTPATELVDGSYVFTAKSTNAIGNDSATSAEFALTVDTVAPTNTVTIDSITEDTGVDSTDFITSDNDGLVINATLQSDLAADERLMYSTDDGATWTDITSAVTGTSVTYSDDNLTSTATVRMRVVDAAGNLGAEASQLVVIDSTAPNAPVIVEALDDVGPQTGSLASGSLTNDTTPTLVGTADPDVQVKIFQDGVEVATVQADQNGDWSYTPATALADGANYVFTATAVDAAGNESAQSNSFELGIYSTAEEPMVAADNAEVLALDVVPTAEDQPLTSVSTLTVASVGLGNVLDLSLIDPDNSLQITVGENTTRQVTLVSQAAGVTLLSDFGLYVYKYDAATDQWQLDYQQSSWLEINLLGGTSDELTLLLDEGQYMFVLQNEVGVNVATTYTLSTVADIVYDYNNPQSVSGELQGNFVSDLDSVAGQDDLPTGTQVTAVNGEPVADTGTTQIVGLYGTLTVDADGNYTYQVDSSFAGPYGSVDTFTYTVTSPDGRTSSADLDVTLNLSGGDVVPVADATVVLQVEPAVLAPTADQQLSDLFAVTVADVGLLDPVLDLGAVDISGAMTFTVDENSVRQLTFEASAGGVIVDADYDLVIYKKDEISGQYVEYHVESSWFQVLLLGGSSDPLALSFTEGDYMVLVASDPAVAVLGGVTLSVTSDVILDYNDPNSFSGSVSGDLTDDDTATVVAVAGQDISTGTSIVGDYGVLVVNPDGTYTYTVNDYSGVAGWVPPYGQIETFSYTTVNADGSAQVSALTIKIDLMDAVDDNLSVQVPVTNDGTGFVTGAVPVMGGNILTNDQGQQDDISSVTIEGQTLYLTDNLGGDSVTITGDYGTLVVSKDGSYTYTANDGAYGVDVFEYRLESVTGSTDSASLSIDVGKYVTGSSSSDVVNGSDGSDVLIGGAGNDILIGGAGNDVYDGGTGNDMITISSNDFVSIDGGDGSDVLLLDGGIDLNLIGDSRITNMEVIDLGTGDDSSDLVLDADSLLSLTDSDNLLVVVGDSADSVTALGANQIGSTAISGTDYNVYTLGSGYLLVEDEITNVVV